MKFYDEVKVKLRSGSGGHGAVVGRKEKYLPFGGPAGGDGGAGGSIIFVCDAHINTLIDFKYKKIYSAANGENGKSHDKNGKDAADVYLKVPLGLIVKDADTNQIIYQFTKSGEKFIIAKGGKGGAGNIHFKNSVRQYPNFALFGEPGEYRELVLEMQLLADIALIGTPNVGKSSIINSMTNQKAKIADYPFTTLIPNMGMVKYYDTDYSIIDIPGLIEGAAQGKGLGNIFLRHILKARIRAMVVDINRFDLGMQDLPALLQEIKKYLQEKLPQSSTKKKIKYKFAFIHENEDIIFQVTTGMKGNSQIILQKKIIFIINKIDLISDQDIINEYSISLINQIQKNFKIIKRIIKNNYKLVSAATQYGIEELKSFFSLKLQNNFLTDNTIPKEEITYKSKNYIQNITKSEIDYLTDNNYISDSQGKFVNVWEIFDEELAYFVYVLPWGNDEAENWFWKKISDLGYLKNFEKSGIVRGDILKIRSIYAGVKDRYIQY